MYDLNAATSNLIEALITIITENSRTVKVTSITRRLKPRITFGLNNSIRKSDKIKRLLYKQPFNDALKRDFIKYRNPIYSLLKRANFDYYHYKVESAAGRPGSFVNENMIPLGALSVRSSFRWRLSVLTAMLGPDRAKAVSDAFHFFFYGVGADLARAIRPLGL